MTIPSHLRLRAAAIAEQFRHFQAAHPALDLIGVRGTTPDAIGVMRLDELLPILDAVAAERCVRIGRDLRLLFTGDHDIGYPETGFIVRSDGERVALFYGPRAAWLKVTPEGAAPGQVWFGETAYLPAGVPIARIVEVMRDDLLPDGRKKPDPTRPARIGSPVNLAEGVEPGPHHVDPERQKRADQIAEAAGFKSPPRIADLVAVEAAAADLPAGDPFLTALDVYAEAIKAHCMCARPTIAEAVGGARQGVIEAHLAGARDRAVGLAHAAEAWNLGAKATSAPNGSIPLGKPMTWGELAAEGVLEEALVAYDAAVAADCEVRTLESSLAVGEARNALLAAQKDELFQKSATIAGLKAQLSAAEAKSKEAEVRRYQPDPLNVPKGQVTGSADRQSVDLNPSLAEKLYTCFFSMVLDDESEPDTMARTRFFERLRILDEVMGALEGRAGC